MSQTRKTRWLLLSLAAFVVVCAAASAWLRIAYGVWLPYTIPERITYSGVTYVAAGYDAGSAMAQDGVTTPDSPLVRVSVPLFPWVFAATGAVDPPPHLYVVKSGEFVRVLSPEGGRQQ